MGNPTICNDTKEGTYKKKKKAVAGFLGIFPWSLVGFFFWLVFDFRKGWSLSLVDLLAPSLEFTAKSNFLQIFRIQLNK